MKRSWIVFFWSFFTAALMLNVLGVMTATSAFAQGNPDQIAVLNQKLAALQANVPPMVERLNTLDKKKEDIQFVAAAYSKQDDKYIADVTAFNAKRADVNRQQALLNPALQSQASRSAQHNANQCSAPQGSNACAGYNAEAAQLNAEMATNSRIQAGIDTQQKGLDEQKGWLDQTKGKLQIIYDGLQSDNAAWIATMAQLKTDYQANQAAIADVQRQLDILKGFNEGCLKAIPPACAMPNTPELVTSCEKMHAACGKMFDGNK